MRRVRVLGLASALALLAAPFGAVSAAETEGVGSATASLTVLGAEVGDVLALRLLGDDVSSTTDPAVSVPRADSIVTLLAVSSAVEALSALTIAPVGVSSTGGEQTQSTDAVSLSSPLSAGQLLPAGLLAVVDDLGARAGITAGLADLSIVGGLLNVHAIDVQTGTDAASAATEAARGVTVDAVTVLDLSALLNALGIPLTSLSLDVVSDLLDELGIDLDGVVGDLGSTVAALQEVLGALAGETGTVTTGLCDTLDGVVGDSLSDVVGDDLGIDDLLGGFSVVGANFSAAAVGDTCTEVVGQAVDALVTLVETDLIGLLTGALLALDAAPLLSVDGVTAQLRALATDSLDTSVAEVVAAIGDIQVGALELPGVDLLATLETVTGLIDEITGALDEVLGVISPSLQGIVEIAVLEQNANVSQAGDYVQAVASLTALRATVTPPDLTELLEGFGAAQVDETIGGLITELGGTLPALDVAVGLLTSALGVDVLGALGPVNLEVASLSVAANHTTSVAAVPPPAGELPRTGTNAAMAAVFGMALLAGALGIRRWLRTGTIPS